MSGLRGARLRFTYTRPSLGDAVSGVGVFSGIEDGFVIFRDVTFHDGLTSTRAGWPVANTDRVWDPADDAEPGRLATDAAGDTWVVRPDGLLDCVDDELMGPLSYEELMVNHGPLTWAESGGKTA